MKKVFYSLPALCILAFGIATSCDKDDDKVLDSQKSEINEQNQTQDSEIRNPISTKFLSKSSCKNLTKSSNNEDEKALFVYEFDRNGNGTFKFINYISNCCTDSIIPIIKQNEKEIIINIRTTGEEPCDCICPFDLTSEVKNMEMKSYHIKYQSKEFDIDLSKTLNGSIDLE